MCWAVLATMAVLLFCASACPGMHSWDSGEVGGTPCGTFPPWQQCVQRCGSGCECQCLQTVVLPLQAVLSVPSDSQHCSKYPFKARINYMGFELFFSGSQLGRTYLTKTYSRLLTRAFLEDANHVPLGPSISLVCFLCMCVVFRA